MTSAGDWSAKVKHTNWFNWNNNPASTLIILGWLNFPSSRKWEAFINRNEKQSCQTEIQQRDWWYFMSHIQCKKTINLSSLFPLTFLGQTCPRDSSDLSYNDHAVWQIRRIWEKFDLNNYFWKYFRPSHLKDNSILQSVTFISLMSKYNNTIAHIYVEITKSN